MPSEIGIALLECYLPEEESEAARSNIALLDADFFDDECVVIVYRLQEREPHLLLSLVTAVQIRASYATKEVDITAPVGLFVKT